VTFSLVDAGKVLVIWRPAASYVICVTTLRASVVWVMRPLANQSCYTKRDWGWLKASNSTCPFTLKPAKRYAQPGDKAIADGALTCRYFSQQDNQPT